MPPGDAQRAWFPEMLAIVKKRWHKNISWKDIILLCSKMQILREKIKQERQIKPVRIFCKICGKYSLSTPLPLSPRSLLFVLKKENIITEDEFKAHDKDWSSYRKTHNLNAYGIKSKKSNKNQNRCSH